MAHKAPRRPLRLWQDRSRGTLIALSLWLAALGSGGEVRAHDQNVATDEIVGARYIGPTRHYAHAVLGDDIEYSGLLVERSASDPYLIGFSEGGRVFEDLAPRLWDVTGDGAPEVVVIETDPAQGAQLAIYGLDGNAVRKIAATPHIGTPFRWLAPVGAADLDGDGHIEIAYIDRPHLAKTLRIWRYSDGAFSEVAAIPGLTNHRIGQDFISGGLRDCGNGPELILASGDWSRVVALSYRETWIETDLGPFTGPESLTSALAC
ncbi:VCBS repeat-containing protein [Ruegeria sp. 2205SS24-7]|uniref:FG-GAP repeat domain-containing protein n=1 Tax=Ruegeria discodermiae TaxID=3064389 RepID=UPI002740872E|nr:VCBS repeat-containing protein [Ruegeria sp. 2205SS24-7]MDP5216790.1 VCBS repeat-containing protein [Ruegeria sp. 2205SS24-7]